MIINSNNAATQLLSGNCRLSWPVYVKCLGKTAKRPFSCDVLFPGDTGRPFSWLYGHRPIQTTPLTLLSQLCYRIKAKPSRECKVVKLRFSSSAHQSIARIRRNAWLSHPVSEYRVAPSHSKAQIYVHDEHIFFPNLVCNDDATLLIKFSELFISNVQGTANCRVSSRLGKNWLGVAAQSLVLTYTSSCISFVTLF